MGNNITKKIASVAISFATVVTLSGVMPLAAHAQSADLQAQITALLAQIQTLQAQLAAQQGGAAPMASYSYTRNLTVGSRGEDVKALQSFLKGKGYLAVEPTGYFGGLTKAALAKYQSAMGISPAVGYFGPKTMASVSAAGGSAGAGSGSVVVPSGSGLSVKLSASQPAATIAPASASRIPFTKLDLTAGAADVTVNSLTVERTGLAADSAFAGVILVDETGAQLGLAKTLNSDHKAVVGSPKVIKAGTTVTWTVAGNRAAAGALGGQTASLAVTAVDAGSSVVSAAYPMTGTTQTINETLSIGSVTMARGPLDPAANQTKNIGTNGYIFTSVKVTAGSAERVYLKSVRWNQTGSVGSADLGNVKTHVEGDAFDTAVSSDGKYYTAVFPGNGILIDKGFSKEVSLRGDIVGGSSRTVIFNLAKRTDLYLVGETYGYGVIPPQTGAAVANTNTSAFSSTEDPWYDASKVTVSSGTMTVSADSAGVPAQNVALNLSNQALGGWSVDVKGEAISVASIKFNGTITGGAAAGFADVTGMTLVDGNGKVLAGPVDGAGATTQGGVMVTFTDTITFPVGVTKLALKGKLGATSGFVNNDTLTASTTPSTDWTTVTGVTTGVTVTPSPTSAVSGNTMTVKGPAVTISVSSVPIAQTVIAGSAQFAFANVILDTAASGEDLRLTALPLEYNQPNGGNPTSLTSCKAYDGATVLTTGSNVVNPTAAGSSTSFTFDGGGITLTRGTSKTVTIKCDISASATNGYAWGYNTTSSPSPTGLVSGQSATVTENGSVGQTMTVASSGTLTASKDTNSPSYAVVSPGQTVELGRIKFVAANEDVQLRQVALQITGAASSTRVDLVGQKVDLYDGLTLIGSAVFASGNTATSSALSGFTVPKDGYKVLSVKGTIAGISNSGPLTRSGDLLSVDYDGNNTGVNGNYGVGSSSGTNITPTGSDTDVSGVRVMRAYPTVAQVALSSGEALLAAGTAKPLYKFKVTANNGDIALYKMSFSVSSSTAAGSAATVTKYSLFAFTNDTFSSPDPNYSTGVNANGLVNAGNCYNVLGNNAQSAPTGGNLGTGSVLVEIYVDRTGCNQGTTTLVIPSGSSRWFRLEGSVGTLAPSGTSETIQTQLEGDTAYPVNAATLMQIAKVATGGADSDTNNDFIWSPISTTTTSLHTDLDWTNGYGVPGLPGTNLTAQSLTK